VRISAILPECRSFADHLDIVMAQPSALAFSHGGEGFGHQLVERFFDRQGISLLIFDALRLIKQALAKFHRFGSQLFVTQGFVYRFQVVNLLDVFRETLQLALVGISPDNFDEFSQHAGFSSRGDYSIGVYSENL
jgi:hypothetical protein